MPMDRRDYPDDWEEVSHRVRFERAGGRCEFPGCGARHGSWIARGRDGEPIRGMDGQPREFDPGDGECEVLAIDRPDIRLVRVILTAAHTCDCKPLCSDEDHLAGYCQLHHLRLDIDKHRATRAANRRRKQAEAGQGMLFCEAELTEAIEVPKHQEVAACEP